MGKGVRSQVQRGLRGGRRVAAVAPGTFHGTHGPPPLRLALRFPDGLSGVTYTLMQLVHPERELAAEFPRAVCCRDGLGTRVPWCGRAHAAAGVEAWGAEPERGASCSGGALCRAGWEPELASTGRAWGGGGTRLC